MPVHAPDEKVARLAAALDIVGHAPHLHARDTGHEPRCHLCVRIDVVAVRGWGRAAEALEDRRESARGRSATGAPFWPVQSGGSYQRECG
jgi:hypothetical protein